jgi:hypothetical protein
MIERRSFPCTYLEAPCIDPRCKVGQCVREIMDRIAQKKAEADAADRADLAYWRRLADELGI